MIAKVSTFCRFKQYLPVCHGGHKLLGAFEGNSRAKYYGRKPEEVTGMAGWKPDIRRKHIESYILTFHFPCLPNNDTRSEYD